MFGAQFEIYKDIREKSRALYYYHARMKVQTRHEHQRQKVFAVTCLKERKNIQAPHNAPLMLIGDRGYRVNSPIKGHLKYGRKWKPTIQSI
jgi:hypothetical protein